MKPTGNRQSLSLSAANKTTKKQKQPLMFFMLEFLENPHQFQHTLVYLYVFVIIQKILEMNMLACTMHFLTMTEQISLVFHIAQA